MPIRDSPSVSREYSAGNSAARHFDHAQRLRL